MKLASISVACVCVFTFLIHVPLLDRLLTFMGHCQTCAKLRCCRLGPPAVSTRERLCCRSGPAAHLSWMLKRERLQRGSSALSRPNASVEWYSKATKGCRATLSIYAGFGPLLRRVHDALEADEIWQFGSPFRQFWPEAFLLDHFLVHRCRVHGPKRSSPIPHFYIVPVLWRSISLLSDRPLRKQLHREAVRLVSDRVLAPGSAFHSQPEMHVVLHTSTAKLEVFGRQLGRQLGNPKLVHLTFEGPEGDPRAGPGGPYLTPGPRTIVVPYFIEPPSLVSKWLEEHSCSLPCAAVKHGLEVAGAGGRTYLRCSANGRLRPVLVAAFRNVSGADVAMIDSEPPVSGRASRVLSNLSRPDQLATFLASLASLRASVFCLVPSGLTASSRRLYEALDAGCVPVVVSDRITLPFAGSPNVRWKDAVLFHPEGEIPTLPARLALIPPSRIEVMRAAGSLLAHKVRFVEGGEAAELVWREVVRLGAVRELNRGT